MIDTIKQLFGFGAKVDYAGLVKQGAQILDVRTKKEYEAGHIQCSINIPVDQLSSNLAKLNSKSTPVITCCASGIRSAAAKGMLKSAGFTNVHNGGSWLSLKNKI